MDKNTQETGAVRHNDLQQMMNIKERELNNLYVEDLRNKCVGNYFFMKDSNSLNELVKITDVKISRNDVVLFPEWEKDCIEFSIVSVPNPSTVTEKDVNSVTLYEERVVTTVCEYGKEITEYGFSQISNEAALIFINAFLHHLGILINSAMSRHLD